MYTPVPIAVVEALRERIRCLEGGARHGRKGESAEFEVEACDAQGRLALPAETGHRPTTAELARRTHGASHRLIAVASSKKFLGQK